MRFPAAAILGAVILACGAVLAGAVLTGRPDWTAHRTANGVAVAVTLRSLPDDQQRLVVTFTPQDAGFHIYSIDLPDGGADGLGIPTRIAVGGDLTSVGRPQADVATQMLRPAGLNVGIPVYPDGPVTFTIPVRQTASDHAYVQVSYGACSQTLCRAPVIDEDIELNLD